MILFLYIDLQLQNIFIKLSKEENNVINNFFIFKVIYEICKNCIDLELFLLKYYWYYLDLNEYF